MGRLFDAVAVLCGLPAMITFEGQAAMALQFAADEDCTEAYRFRWRRRFRGRRPPLRSCPPERLTCFAWSLADWEPLVRAVLADRAAGVPLARISARFHNALAEMAVAVARRVGCGQVVLSGGCFQNALLAERVRGRWRRPAFPVYTHRQVPPGDGGIALGQVARRRLPLCEDRV